MVVENKHGPQGPKRPQHDLSDGFKTILDLKCN